jgi:CxxC-x17-CxxC domain-containing protein
MKNYNEGRGGFGGGKKFGGYKKAGASSFKGGARGGFDGKKKFGGGFNKPNRDRTDQVPELFSAICSSCGTECKVPFRPSGEKPVFCSNCFGRKHSDEQRGGGRERHALRHEVPMARKEVFTPSRESDHAELKRQIASLEAKLNRVLHLLSPEQTPATDAVVMVVAAEPKKVVSKKVVEAPGAAVKKGVKKPTEKVVKKTAVKKAVTKNAVPVVKKTAKKAPAKKK